MNWEDLPPPFPNNCLFFTNVKQMSQCLMPFPAYLILFNTDFLQLVLEQIWIGVSARAAILAHTKRATAMGIASVSKIMFVDKITATSSGIWQIQVLIAVSQVNLSLGQKNENILCSFDLGSQR